MEEIAEQSYDKMEAYLLAQELANDKLDSAWENMDEQQHVFAQINNINLVDSKDKLTKNLEKAGLVFKHNNTVYLIFFKCYKQEVYLLEAIKRKDISAMEQNKNALATVSAEGLEKLKNVTPYKNDKTLINTGKSILGFYQLESTVKMTLIIDFYMKQENFEKIKASLDSKKPAERTKEDVAQYNDAVKEFNKSINGFNSLNKELDSKRISCMDDWNTRSKSFLDKNVPKRNK